ncbi:hypothetical protein Golax_014595 [Gossypium laxum]|uniref:Uncharacterized protein n=1 Tax=Gossypium laxum TaxID=34288 RepID=A0A7J8ZWQ3_9ROSI|nr:hypothetical protein [Gossypium laxum]
MLRVYYNFGRRTFIVRVIGGWVDSHQGAVCSELLGLVLEMIYRGRIEMNWLRRNFVGLDDDLIEVEREQQTRAYIIISSGVS